MQVQCRSDASRSARRIQVSLTDLSNRRKRCPAPHFPICIRILSFDDPFTILAITYRLHQRSIGLHANQNAFIPFVREPILDRGPTHKCLPIATCGITSSDTPKAGIYGTPTSNASAMAKTGHFSMCLVLRRQLLAVPCLLNFDLCLARQCRESGPGTPSRSTCFVQHGEGFHWIIREKPAYVSHCSRGGCNELQKRGFGLEGPGMAPCPVNTALRQAVRNSSGVSW